MTTLIHVELPDALSDRLAKEAAGLGVTPEGRVIDILEGSVAPEDNYDRDHMALGVAELASFLARLPSLRSLSSSGGSEPYWWVKFRLDPDHPLVWHVIQALGFVLNYISLSERLPTTFHPVSAPPYMNGGPQEHLAWVIEASLPFVDAGNIAATLCDRLPDPVEDEGAWLRYVSDDADDEE